MRPYDRTMNGARLSVLSIEKQQLLPGGSGQADRIAFFVD
jgi:hypothetical protein